MWQMVLHRGHARLLYRPWTCVTLLYLSQYLRSDMHGAYSISNTRPMVTFATTVVEAAPSVPGMRV